jgi:hypothetical protein
MASEPKGRNGPVNWLAARAYFLGLPAERRTFAQVARRFGVSDARVGQVARRDGWADDLEMVQELEDAEVKRTVRAMIRSRAERLGRTLEFYDRVNDAAIASLPLGENGQVDLDKLGEQAPKIESLLSSMPGLFKMAELAAGEATDRVAISELQPVLVAFARIAVVYAPVETRGEVIRELEAASAGLVTIDGSAAAA